MTDSVMQQTGLKGRLDGHQERLCGVIVAKSQDRLQAVPSLI
jgi:hypothetical protein